MAKKKNGKTRKTKLNGTDNWVEESIKRGVVVRRKGKLAIPAKFALPFVDERPGRFITTTAPKEFD